MSNESLKKSPLHEQHLQLKGRMVPFAGYELPVQYQGLVAEHKAVRQAAGIFDVSHMGELFLDGAEAEAVLDSLVTGDISKLTPGKALYTVACNESGNILDDLIVYRLAAERFLVVCNASNRDKISPHFASAAKGRCTFSDRSDDYALLALQGPKAAAIMTAIDANNVAELSSFSLIETKLAGRDTIVARTGYTAEDGFEIFCANEDAVLLWQKLLSAGSAHGLIPCGLGARDTLRLEGRLSLYGNELDEGTNPLEAGLGWVVKLDKEADFLGKTKLLAIKAAGTARKIVGLQMVGRGIARHGYPIVDGPEGGAEVGIVTSGSPSPTLGTNIALAYVPSALSAIGTRIGVKVRDNIIEAVVVKTPFYKRLATV